MEVAPTALLGTFDAVIFDFDGTIGDSHAAMMRAYQRWAEEFDVDLSELHHYTGRPSEAVAAALLPAEVAPRAALRMEQLEVSDTVGVVPLPGALAAMTALPAHRRAIATSCTAPLLNARLAATGLPVPDVIVTRDQVVEGKPAPDSFELAARRLGFDPKNCLVAEDAPAGVAGALAAGCAVLGVLTNHSAAELGADWHAETLADVEFRATSTGVHLSLRV